MTRHFTVEEANALLGRVRPLVERMVERRQELATELGRQQELGEIVRSNGGGFNPRLPAQIDEAVEAAAQELTICIEELTTLGVQVKDLDLDEEETFELVGPGDEDYNKNKILITSPIGQGLVGKKRGDVAEIQVPMGKLRFEVLNISYP